MIPMVWQALEWTDWMWGDHDKLEVIIIPRYLKDLTCSSWEPFTKRGAREVRKEGDLWEIITYFVLLELMVRWWEVIHDEIRLMLYWTVDI